MVFNLIFLGVLYFLMFLISKVFFEYVFRRFVDLSYISIISGYIDIEVLMYVDLIVGLGFLDIEVFKEK